MPLVTVIDRIRALNFEPKPRLSWEVGARVRDKYQEITGSPPPKLLGAKTNAGGTHCFAKYPEWMVPLIDRLILERAVEIARQMEFPFERHDHAPDARS